MAHKVKISARLRPRIPGEVDDGGIHVERSEDGATSCIAVANPRDVTQIFKFPFTSCYDHDSTQKEIFERDVEPLIDIVYSGVTVTIFAYGVTSSGKTHTMQGTKTEPGVIPRVVDALFQKKRELDARFDVSLEVSYMEIYKDECYDLLVNRENGPKLPVRENDAGQVFVANLSALPIESIHEFDEIYSRANKHRSVGATNLNRASSRSHAILTVQVAMIDPDGTKTLTGKINLVDLAGSENNKLTGNDPSRMAESAAINKSLSVLGQVVHALNQGASRIPYRNSKLTRILQDALGGSSVGLLICNLAPGTKFRQDTLNTLNFAVRTKNVENKPVVNERDNRPIAKPHFAAVQAPPPRLAAAVLPPSIAGPSSQAHVQPQIHSQPRPSLAPPTKAVVTGSRPSKVPRPSSAFAGGGGGFARFGGAMEKERKERERAAQRERDSGDSSLESIEEVRRSGERVRMITLSEKDIDERIMKAVEAEVARRLEERERARATEEQKRLGELAHSSPDQPPAPTVLTPLLRRHQDLDEELRKRLHELEKKFAKENKECQLADVLSPVSRKKTGRAYVLLARAHSEKGDLQVALEHYRKAELYVPDNLKLKERITDIARAIEKGEQFKPTPKRATKATSKKRHRQLKLTAVGETVRSPNSQVFDGGNAKSDALEEHEALTRTMGKKRGREKASATDFGGELTNSPEKRSRLDRVVGEGGDCEEDSSSMSTGKGKKVRSETLEGSDIESTSLQKRRKRKLAVS